ncbi:NERD nuclease [Arthrobacter sp. Bz4]|nr:NERD nuclease [Arthrobacter sp. Bz4]
MTAGAGAAEQARRASQRVVRLQNELAQATETVARLQSQLRHAERTHRAWNAGAAGELLVADRLDLLESHGWLVLHDLRWPGRPKANLDHVIVGPGGVLVIDAKNWAGDVHLRRGELVQNGYLRVKESAAALEQASAIAALLEPQHRQFVQTWICLVGQPDLKGVTALGVRIEGLNTIAPSVKALPRVLEPEFVRAIYHYLSRLLAGNTSPVLLTTAGAGAEDAAVSTLRRRRTGPGRSGRIPVGRSAQTNDSGNPSNPGCSRAAGPHRRSGKSTKVTKGYGCLGVSVRLAGVALALAITVNLLSGLAQSQLIQPQPDPTITNQTASPGAG